MGLYCLGIDVVMGTMKKRIRKASDEANRASVKKEMAKPRMAKSVREARIRLVVPRIISGSAA